MDDNRTVQALVKQAQDAIGRDWSQAAALATELRILFPDHPAGYQIGATSARAQGRFADALALIVEGSARFPEDSWPSTEMAWTARARGNNDEAVRLAAELRERFPNDPDGYHLGAICSRAVGALDQAAEIATQAQTRFPTLAWPLVELAWTARAKADHEDASRLAADLRERFPNEPSGYQVGATSARALGRLSEIGGILAEAQARFPTQTWPVIELAWFARARGEHRDAIRLSAELRARLPDDPIGYQVGATSTRALGRLDDAAAIVAEGAERFPTHSWPMVEMAWIAKAREDHQEAMRLAAQLRTRFPDDPVGYQIGAASARALGRFEDTNAILSDGRTRFPTHKWPVVDMAWAAKAAGDTDAAIRLAEELRERYPAEPAGFQIGGAIARDQGRLRDAMAILQDAVARFPTQVWPLTDLALATRAAGDTDRTIELAGLLRARFPNDPTGYRIGATFLRVRNRLEEAEAVLRDAMDRFPTLSWAKQDAAEAARIRANRAAATDLVEKLHGSAGTPPRPTGGKVVVVLGMHRAGTSLCTRIVQQLGVDLGTPLLTPDFDNPDGYQEHKAIVDCHRALFEALHVEWDTIRLIEPPQAAFWESEAARAVRDRMKRVVTEQLHAAGGVWAFKDPRTASFIPLWKAVFDDLGVEAVWVLSVRDPRAVAASLFSRNRLPLALGELLWLEHYLDALRHLGPDITGIVHYERWFSDPTNQIRVLASKIGGATEEAIERAASVVRAELRHNQPDQDAYSLDQARLVHDWLSAETPDLMRLQRDAEAMWRGIATLARDRVPNDATLQGALSEPL
jgi:tetratricopeptide (TPR) repeat protein